MDLSIEQILRQFTSKINNINKIYFANNALLTPVLAYQVNFPRIEIIINGQQEILWANDRGEQISNTLYPNDILYVTSNSWNKPLWHKPVTILSILFGKQQIGLSLLHWDGTQIIPKGQLNIARRGPRIGAFIIQAIAELTWHNQPSEQNQTAYFLIHSLLSSTLDLLNADIETASKTTSLFEAIRQYIDTHFREDVTRDFLAKMFYISPNYLSHLFQREGKIGLNEYLNQIRLEYAKSLLKNYDLNVKEIAHASGFKDSNYFCRIFRKKTERSPTEYRRQYHSKLYKK
ncbi:AraC family transcriptional regulator [Gilliamella apicola]|uniref:helix-turn-helix transcriptional regulator n=1 Tax=Gilliamella apicola TaxID=1196095 RepID=UPI000A33CF9E|nr:AraC family transcriptional regulator [Gilliamella apicola]OTQ00030.1 AraC family transcriptional regulator [Gilliamella apicola]OTQ22139.1 AraC family transcriptional regulator [Gilliamella apicola]